MAQAALGLFVLLALAWAISEDRRRIQWRTVITGVALQSLLALLLIGVPAANRVLFLLNDAAEAVHQATLTGTSFVFGFLAGQALPFAETHPGASFILAFQALPLVLTISALASSLPTKVRTVIAPRETGAKNRHHVDGNAGTCSEAQPAPLYATQNTTTDTKIIDPTRVRSRPARKPGFPKAR